MRTHLASLVADMAARRGVAVVQREGLRTVRTTYPELAELSARWAAGLHERGIGHGDRVILWGPNSAEWIAAFFGCLLRGVEVVPLDVTGTAAFAERVAAEVRPKLALCGPDQHITGVARLELATLRETLAAHRPLPEPAAGLGPDDVLQIIYTSGTTAEPKGVVHRHRHILASLGPLEREMRKYDRLRRVFHPLRILHTLPLSHVFGQFMGLWVPPLIEAELHLASDLQPARLVEQIRRERISVLAGVPRLLETLQLHVTPLAGSDPPPGRHFLWRWWAHRRVHRAFGWKFWAFVSGGATLNGETERFWQRLGYAVVQGYGMTETGALVSLNHPFHPSQGSIGKVLPGREIKLGPDGEVLVRGASVAAAGEGEWFATGDLAAQDEQGNLFFKGRKKDVIVTAAGLNIYPGDLEAAVRQEPGVRDVLVVGVEGANGPEPHAALLLAPGAAAEDVVARANGRLAGFQQIRRWSVWPDADFPRTGTGKVLRRAVQETVQGQGTKAVPALRYVLGEAQPAARLGTDLGLDSLGRVELLSTIEQRYGVSLEETAIGETTTVADLQRLIEGGTANRVGPRHRYPRWPWHPLQQAVRGAFVELIARPFVSVLAAPRYRSALTQAPARPLLIVANHVSTYDVPLIWFGLPGPMRRRVAVAMAGEMLTGWRHGNLIERAQWFLVTALFNVFPLPQRSGFRDSFAHAGAAMDRGYHVLVFPEGRRAPDEQTMEFQQGVALLLRDLRCEVLPVRLIGLGELKVAGRGWFRSGRIRVVVGGVLPYQEGEPHVVARRLRDAVLRLQ